MVSRKDGIRYLKRGKVFHPTPNKDGHLQVKLVDDNKGARRGFFVHRLVLLAFIGPCPSGMEGLHADDMPSNNTLSNLRWGTREQNHEDRKRNGRVPALLKTYCLRGHPLSGDNLTRAGLRIGRRGCAECNRMHARREIGSRAV